jgi:hypothetical protein
MPVIPSPDTESPPVQMPPGNAFTVGVLPAVLLVPLPPQALRAVNDNMTAMPLRLEKLDWGMIFPDERLHGS